MKMILNLANLLAWLLMSVRFFVQGGMDVGSYWICSFLFIIANILISKEESR